MGKQTNRREAIREIVRSQRIHTQRDLVDALIARGLDCTQATISRDITEIGLEKQSEGVYMLHEDVHLQRMVTDMVLTVEAAQNLVVVKTTTGAAQGVAASLDAVDFPKTLGSVAGDDTILIVTQDEEHARAFRDAVEKLRIK